MGEAPEQLGDERPSRPVEHAPRYRGDLAGQVNVVPVGDLGAVLYRREFELTATAAGAQGPDDLAREASSRGEDRYEAAGPRTAARTCVPFFGPDTGWLETAILGRTDFTEPREGPRIVEEYDATCLVSPGARAERDGYGNIVVTL